MGFIKGRSKRSEYKEGVKGRIIRRKTEGLNTMGFLNIKTFYKYPRILLSTLDKLSSSHVEYYFRSLPQYMLTEDDCSNHVDEVS